MAFLITPVLSACPDRAPRRTEPAVPQGSVKIRIVIPLRPEHAAAIAAITKSKDLTRMEDIAIAIAFEDEIAEEAGARAYGQKVDPRERLTAYPPIRLHARPGEEPPLALETEYVREMEILPSKPMDLYVAVGLIDSVSGRMDTDPIFMAKVDAEHGAAIWSPERAASTIEIVVADYTFFPSDRWGGISLLLATAASRLWVGIEDNIPSAEAKLRLALEEPAERLKQEMKKQGMDLDVDLGRIDLTPPRIGAAFVVGRSMPGNLPPCEPGKVSPNHPLLARYSERFLMIQAETTESEASVILCADEPVTFRCIKDEEEDRFDAFFFEKCASPFNLTGLDVGEHKLLVLAFDASGNSRLEPALVVMYEVFPPDVKLPSPPKNIKGEVFDGRIDLSWDPNILASHYLVYYGTSPDRLSDKQTTQIDLDIPGLTEEQRKEFAQYGGLMDRWTIENLTNDTTYYFAVAGVDANGVEGSRSEVIQATPKPDSSPPYFAGLNSASPVSDTKIALSWTDAYDKDTPAWDMVYRICTSTSAGECVSHFTATYTPEPDQTRSAANYLAYPGKHDFTVTGLLPNTTYYFVVRAVDQAGNEDTNAIERSAKTSPPPPPPPPTSKPLFRIDGFAENDGIGMTAAGAGDINGDGKPDIIVGIPSADPNGLTDAGSALAYSGVDGTLIWRVDGSASKVGCGKYVGAAGDLNADGRDDFMAIQCKNTQLAAYSGIDASIISPAPLGKASAGVTAPVGDVNGDGKKDFAVGDHYIPSGGSLPHGRVTVYSGIDGSVLHELRADDGRSSYGQALSTAGDLNNDGRADFIVGSYLRGVGEGSATVYSGADKTLISAIAGGPVNGFFGFSVAGADSSKGGGAIYFIGAYGSRSVHAYSSGTNLWIIRREGDEPFGYSVSAIRDMNGDGNVDVVVGAAGTNSCGTGLKGSAHVYSGMDGKLLLSESGRASGDEFGSVVAGIGDVNGDAKGDFLVVARCADPSGLRDAGSVYVFASP